MAIFGALIAYLGRFAGRVVNTIFGWATTALFGKLPDSTSQTLLSVIGLAAVVWLAAALGVIFPPVGAFLLGFIVLPEGVDSSWIRLAMMAVAIIVPGIVGVLSIYLFPPEQRPAGLGPRAKAVALGYPYTVGLAVTLIMMCVFVPVLKLINLWRGWSDEHVPVQVRPDGYDNVLQAARQALEQAGYPTALTEPPLLVRIPHKILDLFALGSFDKSRANQLAMLKGPEVEVLLHSSDLVLSSGKEHKARARSAIARELAFTDAYLTWTKDAHEIEDRLLELWKVQRAERPDRAALERALEDIEDIRRDIQQVEVMADEWEVLYRLCLQVELALLRAVALQAKGASAGEVQRAVDEPSQRINPAA